MNKNLIIRADATTRIGTGHIMRCIALAQAWQEQGGGITFLSHCDSEALHQRIIDEGFDFIPIEKPCPHPDDLTQTLSVLKRHAPCLPRGILAQWNTNSIPSGRRLFHWGPMPHAPSWLVLDGYHFTSDYQKAIREIGYKLLVIDDMAHLDHYRADILLNQNIHASCLHYSCDRDTVKLLGCEYVLLRREFLKYKDWKREIPEKAKKILVTMGGSDPDNVTLKVVKALNSLNDQDLEVKIVAGPANPNINSLEKELRLSPFTFHLLYNVGNMPELMTWADMAISAGGSTCWEVAFMGLPFLTIVLTDNQTNISRGLCEEGASFDMCWHTELSSEKIALSLLDIIDNRNVRKKYSIAGQQLVDGRGARMVVGAVE